jgi:hypothetical protein
MPPCLGIVGGKEAEVHFLEIPSITTTAVSRVNEGNDAHGF